MITAIMDCARVGAQQDSASRLLVVALAKAAREAEKVAAAEALAAELAAKEAAEAKAE